MSLSLSDTRSEQERWAPNPIYYDFARALPGRYLLRAIRQAPELTRLLTTQAGSAYEPGAGTGRILVPIAAEFPSWSFAATDRSQSMLDVLRFKLTCEAVSNISYRVADISERAPEAPFDLLILSSVLHSVPNWTAALETCIAQLTERGTVLLVGEESDLCNLALGRVDGETLDGAPDANLAAFWQEYLDWRARLGIPNLEGSQVGCRWEAQNSDIVTALMAQGFAQVNEASSVWNVRLSQQELLQVVVEKCYSSMFTAPADQFDEVIRNMRRWAADHETHQAVSRQHLVLRVLQRI